jgi:hypothetical protein
MFLVQHGSKGGLGRRTHRLICGLDLGKGCRRSEWSPTVAVTLCTVRSMSTVDRASLNRSSSAYPPFNTQGGDSSRNSLASRRSNDTCRRKRLRSVCSVMDVRLRRSSSAVRKALALVYILRDPIMRLVAVLPLQSCGQVHSLTRCEPGAEGLGLGLGLASGPGE